MKQYVKIAIAGLALSAVFMTGCEQRYRYPCQDPENWKAAECQKPKCEVHRDCPDIIFKDRPTAPDAD
jgi:hypothetical protein